LAVTPIFIFSLPRAGSTLLQRILTTHDEINTTGEPWLLLPLVYAQREHGVYAEYVHTSSNKAINEIIGQLPEGRADYFKAVRKMALSIYNDLNANGEKYFLDKTPRYYLIINEISQIFPDAKFIFLFRNPLSNLASLIQSFWGGKLGDYRHRIDIYEGPRMLAAGYKTFLRPCHTVRYEDLVQKPGETIQAICDYLDLEYNDRMLSAFSGVRLKGSMGDSIGTKNYKMVDSQPLNKWKAILGSRHRVAYAKKILDFIGEDAIQTMGYHSESLNKDLDNLESGQSLAIADRYLLLKCSFFSIFEIPLMKHKVKRMLKTRNYRQYIHF
jgi:hypothetical protein